MGYRGPNGYGQIGLGKGTRRLAYVHRVSYELEVGVIPAGAYICHRCDNPPCVRPDHLFVGTQLDNMRDAASKGRAKGAEGLANWNARLDHEQVKRIRALDAAGLARKDIASQFDITPQHVGQIVRRQSRKAA